MKMEEIPEDVMELAALIFSEAYHAEDDDERFRVIARAILAERERCAKVAESRYTEASVPKNAKGKPYKSGELVIYAANRIAHAIRNHSK